MTPVELMGSRPQPDRPGTVGISTDLVVRRTRPDARLSQTAERESHHRLTADIAYLLYDSRMLAAGRERVDGGWYQNAMIQNTPPEELARRDWLLATSIVNQGNPEAIQAVRDRHEALVEVSVPVIERVAYTLYENRVLAEAKGAIVEPQPPESLADEDIRRWDWEMATDLVDRRDPTVLQPIFQTHEELLALAA